ncbi:unnamed protein product [Rotaria sp. Silwood1]|nr:unnamed protein product [Rotaria sp. Silwood1]CAF4882273.1 unnamed protein product [Rotaria sp. Silwood1]
MNLTSHVTELTIYNERYVPLNVYCLKNLNKLVIYDTNFYEYSLDDESIRAIPSEIGLLRSLRTLHIYNSPVERLPNEFGNLDLLTELFIVNSDLKEIPTVIENLSQLITLKLSDNQLVLLPSTFGKLRSLRTLWLDNNRITSLPSTMSSLTSLNTIYLQSNPLTSIDELNGMNSIQNLYAQNCNIKYLPTRMSYITYFNMSHNNLEDLFGISTLGTPSYYRIMDFSYNQIDLIPPEISQNIGLLQQFLVKHNKLTHLPKELFGLYNSPATILDISENNFPPEELNLIKETIRTRLPQIQVFY